MTRYELAGKLFLAGTPWDEVKKQTSLRDRELRRVQYDVHVPENGNTLASKPCTAAEYFTFSKAIPDPVQAWLSYYAFNRYRGSKPPSFPEEFHAAWKVEREKWHAEKRAEAQKVVTKDQKERWEDRQARKQIKMLLEKGFVPASQDIATLLAQMIAKLRTKSAQKKARKRLRGLYVWSEPTPEQKQAGWLRVVRMVKKP